MGDQRAARVARLRDKLAAHDALLVTALPNIRYLTGFAGSSALVVVSRHDVLLITDFRYAAQAAEEVGSFARVVVEPQSLWTGLWRELPHLAGVETVAFESPHLLHRDFSRLLEHGKLWQWRPTSDVVEELREVKDDGEVALHVEAAKIAVAALSATLPRVRAGMTELTIAGLLEHELRSAGSEDLPFKTIVATGPRSALPQARASDRPLGRGEFLLLDFGAVYRGYCSDVTRTVICGTPDDRQREVHAAVRGANEVARAGIRAGMRGKDADALARRYIEQRGEGPAFGHGLGHGLGLEVHEAPRLGKAVEATLPVGAVCTIEPGIYHAGWGGVRIEDDVHLRADGADLLTDFTRDLLDVG